MIDQYPASDDPRATAFDKEQAWFRGVVNDGCVSQGGCPEGGPAMHHLSFGPDGISQRIFEVCEGCVLQTKCQLGENAWVSARGGKPDLSPTPADQIQVVPEDVDQLASSTLDFDDPPAPVPLLDPKYQVPPVDQLELAKVA